MRRAQRLKDLGSQLRKDGSSCLCTSVSLGPQRKFTPLAPDIHKSRACLQHAERVPDKGTLAATSITSSRKTGRSLPFNLPRPNAPSYGPQCWGIYHEAKADDERGGNGFHDDVHG